MYTLHKKTLTLLVALALMTGYALAGISLPLQPGYAVHTMGMSPNISDGNATLRIYALDKTGYNRTTSQDFSKTISHDQWDIGSLGNVYGITIDIDKNIYATASASWSPGYIGNSDRSVLVGYGAIGAGTSQEINGGSGTDTINDSLQAAGSVYKIDANDGNVTVLAHLPQEEANITNQVCEGDSTRDYQRHTGPGLGNIIYDKFHDQFFVSNFSDGNIYRLSKDGNISQVFDTGLGGISQNGKVVHASYGLSVGLYGKKLYYGTQETNMNPRLYSVVIDDNGSLVGDPVSQKAELVTNLQYTQNIGGNNVGAEVSGTGPVWAAYSDIDFTPDGEMVLGVRVGCKGNFATAYNHGGVTYLLKKDSNGLYRIPSDQLPGNSDVTYSGSPDTSDNVGDRSGDVRYDKGAIPMRADGANKLKNGPDDGYGGVAVWLRSNGHYDYLLTSGDMQDEDGPHGFMQIRDHFSVESGLLSNQDVNVYQSFETTDDLGRVHDYKGIGGDVEVLSVVPVSVGSCVWYDKNRNGLQDDGANSGIGGVELKLVDEAGNKISTTITNKDCTYKFDNLPEGKYRVCFTGGLPKSSDNTFVYLKTPKQNGTNDNNESDSNFMADSNCSALFSVFANSQPKESNSNKNRGDEADDNASNPYQDKNGNMTIDFGFVKNTFDLALKKEVKDPKKEYKVDENVTFTITVYNQGTITGKNIQIQDDIPDGLTLNDNNWTGNGKTAVLKNKIASLAPGKSITRDITFTITKSSGKIINIAEIQSATNDSNLSDDDSAPGDNNPCKSEATNGNNDNIGTKDQCDDADPAWIMVVTPSAVEDAHESKSDTASADEECACNNIKGNKVDAMSTWMALLLVLSVLMVGFLQSREELEH